VTNAPTTTANDLAPRRLARPCITLALHSR
jgi:hypothetical protein